MLQHKTRLQLHSAISALSFELLVQLTDCFAAFCFMTL